MRILGRVGLLASAIAFSGAFAFAISRPSAAVRRAGLVQACLGESDPESCERLGDLLERGDLSARYAEEPGHFLALACQGGIARACTRAESWAKKYADYEVFELDVGCMVKGSAFACEETAKAIRGDEAEESGDEATLLALARSRMRRAHRLYLERCAKSDAESCLGASRVYDAGFGVEWNPREASAMARKACDLGSSSACERAAESSRAPGDVLALYGRACEQGGGSPHGCLELARAHEAYGSPRANVEASYRRACELASLDACGWIARRAGGVDAASPAVRRGLSLLCEADHPDARRACGMLEGGRHGA
jgi:TPR repeat protein